jgi:hypothetical protein
MYSLYLKINQLLKSPKIKLNLNSFIVNSNNIFDTKYAHDENTISRSIY